MSRIKSSIDLAGKQIQVMYLGQCVVRCDNEVGHGDHRHFGVKEIRATTASQELCRASLTGRFLLRFPKNMTPPTHRSG